MFILETLALSAGGIAAISSIPYITYLGFVYRFKVFNIIKYKHVKKQIYKGIYKAISEQDIQSLRDYFRLLSRFDAKYDRHKSVDLKKKLGICDEILSNRKLFKLKFDSDYLVEHASGILSSNEDIQKREMNVLNKERELDTFNDIDNIRKKEDELKIKESELKEKEEEIFEIISNLNQL